MHCWSASAGSVPSCVGKPSAIRASGTEATDDGVEHLSEPLPEERGHAGPLGGAAVARPQSQLERPRSSAARAVTFACAVDDRMSRVGGYWVPPSIVGIAVLRLSECKHVARPPREGRGGAAFTDRPTCSPPADPRKRQDHSISNTRGAKGFGPCGRGGPAAMPWRGELSPHRRYLSAHASWLLSTPHMPATT